MKKALFLGPNKKLLVKEDEVPEVGRDEILLKVKTCGICGSDLSIYHGVTKVGKVPIVLGHEFSGIIEKLGSDVEEFEVGDRVAVDPVISCGKCYNCISGRNNICEKWMLYGIHVDGGLREYANVKASNCIKLPDNITFEEGAAAVDTIGTPYHAIRLAKISLGETIAIHGCGGIGMGAVELAHLTGAYVIAIDIIDEKLKVARQLGADVTINANTEDPVQYIRKSTNSRGVDIAMVFTGIPDVFKSAFDSVRRGGRVVAVGLSHRPVEYDFRRIVRGEINIMGSYAVTKSDIIDVMNLFSRKKIDISRIITHRFPLDKVNDALYTLENNIGNPIRVFIDISP